MTELLAHPPGPYRSTSCGHELHDCCSADRALDADGQKFARRPAQCKFCAEPCVCPCHQEAEVSGGER
jgi:hypothetical protein